MIASRLAFHLLDFFIATLRHKDATHLLLLLRLLLGASILLNRSQLCFIVSYFLLIPCIQQTESNGNYATDTLIQARIIVDQRAEICLDCVFISFYNLTKIEKSF